MLKINPSKQRLSNIELLRIVAMFGVVLLHLNFGTFGIPDKFELLTMPTAVIQRIILEGLVISTTNVFVLISGYFGIRFKVRSMLKLLFQCAFFLFGIWGLMMLLGKESLGMANLARCLMFTNESVWFVKAYLGMYILAPVLNCFVDNCAKNSLLTY